MKVRGETWIKGEITEGLSSPLPPRGIFHRWVGKEPSIKTMLGIPNEGVVGTTADRIGNEGNYNRCLELPEILSSLGNLTRLPSF
jgi:hypothetical protein